MELPKGPEWPAGMALPWLTPPLMKHSGGPSCDWGPHLTCSGYGVLHPESTSAPRGSQALERGLDSLEEGFAQSGDL